MKFPKSVWQSGVMIQEHTWAGGLSEGNMAVGALLLFSLCLLSWAGQQKCMPGRVHVGWVERRMVENRVVSMQSALWQGTREKAAGS